MTFILAHSSVVKPIPILVICPRQIDYFNCQTIPAREKYDFHFLDAPLELSGFSKDFDMMAYLERCRQYIRQHDIQIVLATRDIPSLLQAQLCQEFEHLRGASVESAFICLHKYYTHKTIDFASSQYTVCLLDKNQTLSKSIKEVQEIEIPFPWMMKPCTTACSSSILKVSNIREAQKALNLYQKLIVENLTYLSPFLKTYLDSKKYPLIQNVPILVEEYIDFPHKACVDGCVSNKEIIIWGICDSHYFSSKPECFADFTFPSTLPKSIQAKLTQAYQQIVQRLIEYGFNNQFIDVEFFISNRGEIKVMEVNGRMIPISASLYRQCLNQGDPYTALIEMGMGSQPKTPTLNGLVGGIFYLQTFAKDFVKKLFDFERADNIPNVEIRVRVNPQHQIRELSSGGFTLATINLVGESYEEIHQQANTLRSQLLKQPEFSPWN